MVSFTTCRLLEIDHFIPMSLRNRIVRFPHLFGLRVMRLDNCPLGTAPKLYQDVRQCLKKFDIDRTAVLDVGAHRGEVTQDLLATFPSVRVHAFEPSPSMFNLLRRRFLGNTRVRCHQLAISSSSGELLFEPRPEEPGLARLTEQRSPSTIVVNSTTLDEFITSQSIEIVPLLKTDTEGNETQVLLGAVNALFSSCGVRPR